MGIFTYKGYEGTIESDSERLVSRGKILFIRDLVTYETEGGLKDLKREFEEAVDDYLATCRELGRDPQKPVKGVFQVRVSPEIHKAAILRSIKDNVKLNETVGRAMEAYLCGPAPAINHITTVNISSAEPGLRTITSLPSGENGWQNFSSKPETLAN